MRISKLLESHRDEIHRVVLQNHACNPRIFGSAISNEDTEGSDLDVLVDPSSETTLLDIARIHNQLQRLLGVPVDVLTPKALPESFRDRVLAEAVPV